MRKLILISILITAGVLYTGANSANAQSKFSFGVNIGQGIPMGDYAKHDSTQLPLSHYTTRKNSTYPKGYNANDTNQLNGFAKTGFSFNVYGQYMIVGPIGIKLMVGGTMNSYDIATYNSIYTKIWNESSPGASSYTYTWTAGKSYYIGQYMLGPCLKLPVSGKLRIEGQILAGLVTGSYPTLTGDYSYSGHIPGLSESGTQTYTISSGSVFGYNINAGIEYMLIKIIGIHLNVGYTGSSFSYPTYNIVNTQTQTLGGYTIFSTLTQNYNVAKTMSMGLLQITTGASIDL
jgi:hypothetical protein